MFFVTTKGKHVYSEPTDDKPRAMSNLFGHCRGAKEEEIY